MTRRPALALAILVGMALGASAPAQTAGLESRDPEVTQVRQLFEYGKYFEVLKRAQDRIDAGELTEEELAALHQYAGLAAFNLDNGLDAERHLTALLRIDPDRTLDPFVYPPPAIHFFDKLKEKLGPELEAIRREKRIVTARRRADEARRERELLDAENARRRSTELSRKVTVRTVEKRIFLLNFLPFGAGQFQQGRTGMGALLAASEGVLGIASLVGYFAAGSLIRCVPYTEQQTLGGPTTLNNCGIPAQDELQGQIWRTVKISAGIAFYGVTAFGIVDALIHHKDEVVTTREVDAPALGPAAPAPAPTQAPPARTPLGIRPLLFPTAGGAGAGVVLTF